MSEPARARFEPIQATSGAPGLTVDFNPASLKTSVANKIQDPAETGGGAAAQHTRTTTTKLELELVFDTTESGEDVRARTGKLKDFAVVAAGAPTAPPRIAFVWGRFRYEGMVESLNETLEFWSVEGVPLRASVQLTMQGMAADTVAAGAAASATLGTVPSGGFGVTKVATDAGDPRAARRIAAANGVENMRMPGGGALAVGGGIELRAAAGFQASAGFGASAGAGFAAGASAGTGFGAGASASAGVSFGAGAVAGGGAAAGFGASAGAGFGASAGAGFGGSAGAGSGAGGGFGAAGGGFGASASFSAPAFGASATAGASAGTGAFAGLGAGSVSAGGRIDPGRLLPPPPTAGASFELTGRVTGAAAPGLSAKLSPGVSFGARGG
jgi:hypothetical protein